MKFMLLFQSDEKRWADLSEAERRDLTAAFERYTEESTARGWARHAEALYPSTTATTLRLHEGRCVVTDGPFAENQEVLGACQVIECQNLDEALDLAANFPLLCIGASVEVRPIRATF